MASYGKIYEFVRDSQNGAEIHIVISKKNHAGESAIRPLGRAPLLKRENNGQVFGTSLEIYAECKVDGEFAQFYTSSADEYKVEVYKDDSRIWSGFISPELYSEPDIAPPYDVQIIATDGLGELRNYEFENTGVASVYDHLSQLISHTGLPLETVMASDLRYYDGASASEAPAILDFRIDLSHEDGASCYDVLQNLLSSLNASITQFNDRWFLFRETDFIRLASADGLKTFIPGGIETLMDVASFGSAKTCAWWPIGQLSSVIEPAKNRLILISPNSYKKNVLDDSWTAENGASYDEAEGAYILPDEGSYITQKLDFAGEEVGYRLALRVSARNVGSGDEDQALGVRVVIDGRSYAGERQYWLIQPASSDRGIGSYMWKTSEGTVEAELAVPSDSDTSADAQDIDIILPLYRNDSRSYIYAKTVEVTVYNPAGIHDIYVYGVSLSKYDQFDGYQANVVLNNGAREEGSSIDLSLSDGSMTPAAGNVFMSGIPLLPEADEAIASWAIGATPAEDYIRMMSKDYSRMVALPRMSYKGVLNVPHASIPVMFVRDNTFYFPRTYSYDLYNDELEVDLISIPAAELSIESLQIAQIADARGVPSSGGSGGGGGIGIGGIDLSKYVTIERLASMWQIDDKGNLVAEKQVVIKNNLIVNGDTSSGGSGKDTPAIGTVTGIKVNGTTYNPTAGIVTIPDYPTTLEWDAIGGKPSFATVATSGNYDDLSNKPTIPSLTGYATEAWVSGRYLPLSGGTLSGGLTLGKYDLLFKGSDTGDIAWYDEDNNEVVRLYNNGGVLSVRHNKGTTYAIIHGGNIASQSVKYATSAGSAPASDVYAWAKASTKPAYTTKEVTESGNLYFTNVRAVAALTDTLASYATQSWVEGKKYITASAIPTLYVLTIKKADGTTLVAFDPEEEDKTITLGKADVGLGNVENTALSTWAGSAKITTLGTITSGTWNGSKIANSYLANSAMIIAGNSVSLGDSLAVATLQNSLGLGSLAYKSSLVASDIPALLYLPLSGGTIESSSSSSPLIIKTSSNAWLTFRNASGYLGEFGYSHDKIARCTDTSGAAKIIVHDGNIGSYKAGDSDMLGSRTLAWVQGNGLKIRRVKTAASATPADANVDLAGGGMIYSYSNTSSYLTNGPTGMGYGHVWQVGSYGSDVLDGQFAWDSNHNSQEDTTGKLWWRSRDSANGWTYAKWHQIAFTDSNVASATKLQTARTIWGQSFDGTGNVTGNLYLGSNILYGGNNYNILDISGGSGLNIGYGIRSVGSTVYWAKSHAFYVGDSHALTINSSGNVTIGSSDLAGTSAKLYVNGNTTINGVLDVNNSVEINRGSLTIVKGQIIRFHNTTDNTFIEALGFRGDSFHIGYGNRSLYDTYVQGNNIVFRPGAGTEAMRLNSSGAMTVASTILASSVICGTTRLRVNAPGSTTVFGFIDALPFQTTTNVASVHIGSCYGGSSDITNTTEYSSGASMTAISIYRGKVGIGKRWSDTELRALHDAGIYLGVAGGAKVDGALTVGAGATINGNLVVTGDVASA